MRAEQHLETSIAAARAVRLRHVSDAGPGIVRRRRGRKGFTFVGPDGRRVTSKETLARIRALAIPPAWVEVWICPLVELTAKDFRTWAGR